MAPRLSDVNDVADGEPYQIPWGTGGAGQPPVNIHGYDAAILIDVCKAVLKPIPKMNLPIGLDLAGVLGASLP
ncbi:MAG: hypothetical protein ACLP4V_34155 [Methylocella sp.]